MKEAIIVTADNLADLIVNNREFKDVLIEQPHPKKSMAGSGFTLHDYILDLTAKRKAAPYVIEDLNRVLNGEDSQLHVEETRR